MLSIARSPKAKKLEEYFNGLGKKAFSLSHWDLADMSGFDVEDWRTFLTDPEVVKYIQAEMEALSEAESRKMVIGISDRAKSTGTAQTLLALDKSRNNAPRKAGPIFIYSAVPLNIREQEAPNVTQLTEDPFRITKE